jgi:hypothetical protein
LSREAKSGRGVALRCLLIFAVWQGPIPWWHSHGALATGPNVSASWLPGHLARYHPACGLTSPVVGWHMHLFYPAPPTGENGGNEPLQEQNLLPSALTDSLLTVASMASTATALDPSFWQVAQSPLSRDRSATPLHFFDGFAPTLALPLRFGVARC